MIRIKRAHSHTEIIESLQLLGKNLGLEAPWVLKQHALPTTTIVIAQRKKKTIATLCIFSPSSYGLPLENKKESYKQVVAPKMLELSHIAYEKGEENKETGAALLAYALQFGRFYCHAESFVQDLRAYEFSASSLSYLNIQAHQKIPGVFIFEEFEGLEEKIESLKEYSLELPNPLFPYSPQRMEPETMKALFIDLTKTFESMSIRDFRTLRNLYDDQKFQNIFPELNESYNCLPKEQRFTIHCTGNLRSAQGQTYYVELLDVSPSGMKLQLDYDLSIGHTYYLSLDLGPKKECEILAKCIWFQEETGTSGLLVTNKNKLWNDLFEYLKNTSLKTIA